MAYDFKYIALCDHRIRDRRYIEPDGRTIKLNYPSSKPKITLLRNSSVVEQDDPLYGYFFELDQEGSSDFYNEDIPTSLDDRKRSVILNQESKSLDDLWEVYYTVPVDMCRKCQGTKVVMDWSFDRAGKLNKVIDEEKLAQDLKKLFLTIRSSHLEHPWYGTTLNGLISIKLLTGLDIRIAAELQETLERFVQVQSKQSIFQDLSSREIVRELLNIDVRRGTGNDADSIYIDIALQTDAATNANVTFGVQE
jgi:phage baseplate assembly protein W